ncbi:hypothetical protein HN011_001461 [Eciton burchellii]|nr:hypothetical protein HN011_001461 [Eciton burchellii]
MRRNPGWTAVLATWTILLVLNSGLAGERAADNSRLDNEHVPREAHRGAKFHTPDTRASDDSALRGAGAVAAEFKGNREPRVGGRARKRAATPTALRRNDGDAVRLTAGGIAMENARSRSRMIARKPSPRSRSHLQSGSGPKRVYAFSSGCREQTTTIERDFRRTFGERRKRKQRRNGRIFSGESETMASPRDGYAERPRRWDSSARKLEDSAIARHSVTVRNAEGRRRGGFELAENTANGWTQADGQSRISAVNCSRGTSERNDAIANAPNENSLAGLDGTTLIREISRENEDVDDGGNATSRRRLFRDKAAEFSAVETYKRDDAEYSKTGFRASTMTREDKRANEEPFTLRAADALDKRLAGNKISSAEPPLASRQEKSVLRVTNDVTGSQHGSRSFLSNIVRGIDGNVNAGESRARGGRREEEKSVVSDAMRGRSGVERDPSSINSLVDSRGTSARVAIKPAGNPMHARRVTSCMVRERPRTIVGGIRSAYSRSGLRNASDSSRSAELELLLFERGRERRSRKSAIDAGRMSARRSARIAQLIDERSRDPERDGHRGTFAKKESIFAAATASIADTSNETWKINAAAKVADVAGLRKNIGQTTDRSGGRRDAARPRAGEFRESRHPRYKHREIRDTSSGSMSSPSVPSASSTSSPVSAGEASANTETLPSSRSWGSREEGRSIPRYIDSDTPGLPLTEAPNASFWQAPAFTDADNLGTASSRGAGASDVTSESVLASTGSPHGTYSTFDPLPRRNAGQLARNASENATAGTLDAPASLDQWPVKHSAVVEGDLVLGGLMMVHEREDTVTCGPVMPQGGVQALEAMLYTLDILNERGIVPGVKIGAHILDDCDKDTYGLEMAVDFIKGTYSSKARRDFSI